MDTNDTHRLSMFLSRKLDFHPGIGSEETVNVRRFVRWFNENLRQYSGVMIIHTGSKAEGLDFASSDDDCMLVINNAIVVQPHDVISETDTSKTVLVLDNTDCRPGYTLLRFQHEGVQPIIAVMHSLNLINGSKYLSSSIFLRHMLTHMKGEESYIHGPCSGLSTEGVDMDIAPSFHCLSWPSDLSDFGNRTKYCNWPSRQLVRHIIKQGFHVVAIGDKQSSLFAMQWRISFAFAEKTLVKSFNHVQLKTYALLKIFLKECIERDECVNDLLCSYFMKTIVFHAVEHSESSLWVDDNIIQCFWYCFTILLQCVQTGFLPNYFILSHNMFLSKIAGENRTILLRVLNRHHSLGHNCLFLCRSLQSLPQLIQNSPSFYPPPGDERCHEFNQDMCVWVNSRCATDASINSSQILKLAHTAFRRYSGIVLDVGLLYYIHCMTAISGKATAELIQYRENGNKTAYRQIKKHKRFIHVSAEIDTSHGIFSLATFYYNVGCYRKAFEDAIRVIYACQQRGLLQPYGRFAEYVDEVCGKGYTLLQKAKRSFVFSYAIHKTKYRLYPPELDMEVQATDEPINLPSLPYATFLLVLSAHRVGNTAKAQTLLGTLVAMMAHPIYGECYFPILYNLVGICHQLLGNTQQAVKAFEDSCRQLPSNQAAAKRIIHLRQTPKEKNETRDKSALDYCNVPLQKQNGGNHLGDVDDDNYYHKTMFNIDPLTVINMHSCIK